MEGSLAAAERTATASKRRVRRTGRLELGLIALIALGVRLVDLGFPPFIDELHHIMAGASLLETGTLVIHEGVPYLRGRLFTYVVAGFFAIFGESLVAARLPSVIGGVLLICLVFAWLRAEAGRTAAWTAGLLLCFAPIALYLSQWARFYSLHALLFWLGAFGVYRLVARADPVGRRWWIAAGVGLALVLAYHLQVTTLLGLAGLALFVALLEGPRFVRAARNSRHRWLLAGVAGAALVGAAAAAVLLGVVDTMLRRAAMVDVWAVERAGNPRFYHWMFSDQYGFLWSLFPVAVLLAVARRWQLGLLFATVFGVAFVGHSVAAWKAERFVYYLLPAFFSIWGLAAAELLPWVWRRLSEAGRALLQTTRAWIPRLLVAGALGAAVVFAIAEPAAYSQSRQILLQGNDWSPPATHLGERYRGHPDWEAVAPILGPLSDSLQVVIGQPDLKVIYYLGDVDYVLYASYLVDIRRVVGLQELEPEFTVWDKVGRPLVSEPESVDLIMRCHARGLIVAEEHVWRWRGGVPPETADFIEQNARPHPLPEETGILAFRWETAEPERSDRCVRVREAREEAPIRRVARRPR